MTEIKQLLIPQIVATGMLVAICFPQETGLCTIGDVPEETPQSFSQKQQEMDPEPQGEGSEDQQQSPDFSKLPPELLKDIFDYLKKDLRCVKPLTETCTKFRDILTPRLRLCINFAKVFRDKRYPDIKRSYSEIMFIGDEVDNSTRFLKVIEPSADSLTKLSIVSHSNARCRIKFTSLLDCLRLFSNLRELVLTKVLILEPYLKFEKARIRTDHYPQLLKLKKLTLNSVGGAVRDALQNLEGLEELVVPSDTSLSQSNEFQLIDLVWSQKHLKKLETRRFLRITPHENIETLVIGSKLPLDHTNLFENFPNLKTVKVVVESRHQRCSNSIFTRSASLTLETIKIVGNLEGPFDMEFILPNYPSLKVFKSYNLNWRKA